VKAQEAGTQWLQRAYRHYQKDHTSTEEDYARLLKRVGVSPAQISQRMYFLADFHQAFEESRIFKPENFAGISGRQAFFLETTRRIFSQIYSQRDLPGNLIHVTCTGYVSPSAAQLVAAEKSPSTVVTHSYHMGCYGAFPALRIAQGLVAGDSSKAADVVHTELCTLHLNPQDPSLEQMVVQTLFSDGVAAYRVSHEKPRAGFELLHLGEFLIPETSSAMSWNLTEMGFQMTLSKDVPSLISNHLRDSLEQWEQQIDVPVRSLLKSMIVAVHPGGPKIIDFVKTNLELNEEQVKYSRHVLFDRGNMSSATVPHIWKEILDDKSVADGTLVLSMAFGPGLTLSLSLMRVVR
jgi:predicted naringenin-chalcone synthase